jgi:hypothetical protein
LVAINDGFISCRSITFSAFKKKHNSFFLREFIADTIENPFAWICAVARVYVYMYRTEAIRAVVSTSSICRRDFFFTNNASEGFVNGGKRSVIILAHACSRLKFEHILNTGMSKESSRVNICKVNVSFSRA